MGADTVITVENVGKRYRLRGGSEPSLKGAVLDLIRPRGGKRSEFWALSDINFTVSKGESLGIIGSNGAGKSTLLSLLARTKEPTKGRIETTGAISSLLELGAGFHPDLTGRENVFLAGAIMGLSRARMKTRFKDIVQFAGLEEFIDQPVKYYSSGMYVRLGFAVAVEVDPDILLTDEVLAVGDANFQRKCLRKMEEFKNADKTMIMVSHDLGTIQKVSDRILLLDEGRTVELGEPSRVMTEYQSLCRKKAASGLEKEWGTGKVRITNVEFVDDSGKPAEIVRWGQPLTARLTYEATERVERPVFGFGLSDQNGRLIYGNNTQIEKFDIHSIEGKGRISLRLDKINMAGGTYLFSFSVHSWDHKINYHRLDNCFPIEVAADTGFEGCCFMPCEWKT